MNNQNVSATPRVGGVVGSALVELAHVGRCECECQFQTLITISNPDHKQMGEEGERDCAGGGAADLGLDTMERLHLEESEDMASGGSCEHTSKELLKASIGESPERSPEEAKSSARNVDLKPESIQSGSSKNREEKVAKKEQRKVPRHRRFWESSDCSCSKEVSYIFHRRK